MQISATGQKFWESGRRATKGPQGLDQEKEALRSQVPSPQKNLCFHELPRKPTEILSIQMCPKKSSLGTKSCLCA